MAQEENKDPKTKDWSKTAQSLRVAAHVLESHYQCMHFVNEGKYDKLTSEERKNVCDIEWIADNILDNIVDKDKVIEFMDRENEHFKELLATNHTYIEKLEKRNAELSTENAELKEKLDKFIPKEGDETATPLCSHCDNTGCGAFKVGLFCKCQDFTELIDD